MSKASSSDTLVPAGENATQSTEPLMMSQGQLSLFQIIGAGLLLVGWGMLGVTGYVQFATSDVTSQLAQTIATSDPLVQQTDQTTTQLPPPPAPIQPAPLPGTTTPAPVLAPPTVQFSVAGGNISIAEVLYVKPSRGTKVKAFIQNKAISLSTQLDEKQASPQTLSWAFRLDNLNLPEGTYNFMAQVYADDRWYEQKSDESFTIFYTATSSAGAPATNQAPAPQPGTTAGEPNIAFPDLPPTLSGEQAIVLQMVGVTKPRLVIKDVNNKVVLDVAPSSGAVPPTYAFIFDTRRLPNATYYPELRYEVGTQKITTPGPTIIVSNTTGATATTTSPANFFEVVQMTDDETARYQTFEFYGNDLAWIEVYLKSFAQTTPNLLGQAKRQTGNVWNYTVDTRSLPVGTYQLVLKYRRGSVVTTHPENPTFIVNRPPAVATSTSQQDPIQENVKALEPIVKQSEADVKPVEPLPPRPTPAPVPTATSNPKPAVAALLPGAEQIDEEAPKLNVPRVETAKNPKPIIENNQMEIDEAIARYTAALRSGDESAIKQTRNAVLALGVNLAFAEDGDIYGDSADVLYGHLEELIYRAEKIEKLVRERTNEQISIDTDQDGITDFDEVTLYKSDPKNPDTDADGFLDGPEILTGFDPLHPGAEVAVVYESPKEAGVVRTDVFTVDTIAPIVEMEPEADGVDAQAQITGTGLPNSFVTLFIFSTPVVVTLKTADDGSWVYKFDKELEDGEHEVYVGVTDNAGAIVAKSNPFRFVKEAQAFSPITDQNATVIEETAPRGIESPVWITAVASLVVLLVGLILLLLGRQFDRNRVTASTIQA
jgi:hypothetical protein